MEVEYNYLFYERTLLILTYKKIKYTAMSNLTWSFFCSRTEPYTLTECSKFRIRRGVFSRCRFSFFFSPSPFHKNMKKSVIV